MSPIVHTIIRLAGMPSVREVETLHAIHHVIDYETPTFALTPVSDLSILCKSYPTEILCGGWNRPCTPLDQTLNLFHSLGYAAIGKYEDKGTCTSLPEFPLALVPQLLDALPKLRDQGLDTTILERLEYALRPVQSLEIDL